MATTSAQTTQSMSEVRFIPDIVDKVVEQTDRDEKIRILRENDSKALRTLFSLAYNKNFRPALTKKRVDEIVEENRRPPMPDHQVPYEASQISDSDSHLYGEYRILPMLFEGSMMLKPQALEDRVRQLQDVLDRREMELVVRALKKQQLGKTITEKLVREAFPNLPMHEQPKKGNTGKKS